MKTLKNKTVLTNMVCALLMIVLLVLQFLPYWQYAEDGGSCSISGYVWFPTDHKELESWISAQVEGYDLNGFVGAALLVFGLAVTGTAFCLFQRRNGWPSVLVTACGAAGMIVYLCNGALRLGSVWLVHLLVCAAVLALGIYSVIGWVRGMKA